MWLLNAKKLLSVRGSFALHVVLCEEVINLYNICSHFQCPSFKTWVVFF